MNAPIFTGSWGKCHLQGIAVDRAGGYIYYSFTTKLVKARLNGYTHDEVVYIGDDYGLGGNDESVYLSDFHYLTIDNYLDFPEVVKVLL